MKKVAFTVTLEFSGKISDDKCLREVAQKIALAIKPFAEVDELTPDYIDEYTKTVTASSEALGISEHVVISEF